MGTIVLTGESLQSSRAEQSLRSNAPVVVSRDDLTVEDGERSNENAGKGFVSTRD